MPIYRKTTIQPFLEELDEFYQRLRKTLEGSAPSADLAPEYQAGHEEFEKQFVHIQPLDLDRGVGHFRVAVDAIKELRKKEYHAQKRQRP